MINILARNLLVLALLIGAQLLVLVGIEQIPGRLDIHWAVRMFLFAVIYVAIGGLAFRVFAGPASIRYSFVMCVPILTVLASLQVLPTDPAYPYAELLFVIPLLVLALGGAFLASRVWRIGSRGVSV